MNFTKKNPSGTKKLMTQDTIQILSYKRETTLPLKFQRLKKKSTGRTSNIKKKCMNLLKETRSITKNSKRWKLTIRSSLMMSTLDTAKNSSLKEQNITRSNQQLSKLKLTWTPEWTKTIINNSPKKERERSTFTTNQSRLTLCQRSLQIECLLQLNNNKNISFKSSQETKWLNMKLSNNVMNFSELPQFHSDQEREKS
jgi:hypothetical protein